MSASRRRPTSGSVRLAAEKESPRWRSRRLSRRGIESGEDRFTAPPLSMALRFFNTYSREIEEFQARDRTGRTVTLYTCGPTVYSRAHIGNFRAYIFEDL